MKLPSKELMGEVLLNTEEEEICIYELCCGRTIRYSIRFKCRNNDGTFNYEDDEINIYEFAFKCKEWAKLKHFIDIDSHPGCARWGAKAVSHNGKPSVFYEQVFIGRTEPEAIFKACEYIMDQTKCGS